MKNYTLPLQLGKILKREQHPECDRIEESIANNIHLILMTRFGENRYDVSYGCNIWEYDFELLPQVSSWKVQVANSIADSMKEHEKRLTNIIVKVHIDEKEFVNRENKEIRRIKKRIHVRLTANLIQTNEVFRFEEEIYFSPVSLD